jgi:hypothetical protein
MLRNVWLIVVFCALLLVQPDSSDAGGDKKDKGKDAKAPNYYPLQEGNQWTYQLTVNGNAQTMVSKIAKIETIDQVKLARLEADVGGNVGQTEHLQQTDKGIFRHRSNGLEVSPPLMLMKYPFKAGEKWGGEFTALGQKAKYTCEAGEETVEVVAGKFKTARIVLTVEQNGVTIGTTYWFAENIGFVKQTVDLNGINILAELQKYELKKAGD